MSVNNQQVKTYHESLVELKQALENNVNEMLVALEKDESLDPFDIHIIVGGKQFKFLLNADLYDDLDRLVNNQIDEA